MSNWACGTMKIDSSRYNQPEAKLDKADISPDSLTNVPGTDDSKMP